MDAGIYNIDYWLLIYLAVWKRPDEIQQIIVDRDYSGELAENTLKNYLLALLRRKKPNIGSGFVVVNNIKGSHADKLARAVFQGKLAPDVVLTMQDVDEALQK